MKKKLLVVLTICMSSISLVCVGQNTDYKYKSDISKYSVEFPAKFDKLDDKNNMHGSKNGGHIYMAYHAVLNKKYLKEEYKSNLLLLLLYQGVKNDLKAKVVSQKNITVNGYNGKRAIIKKGDLSGYFYIFIDLDKGYAYNLIVIQDQNNGSFNPENAENFAETFKILASAEQSNNVISTQNLFKSATYTVEEYKIEKVRGKKESHVYPDVKELNVQLGEDIFGNEFTKFSFVNVGGEQSFMTWFNAETIHNNNIVQEFSMLDGPNSQPTKAYFFNKGILVENNTIYPIIVSIPDVKNGIVHKITIKTDKPNFTQDYLFKK